eukprot:TRINITY_DN42741_c0_g1_i1.p1 TRINITY_DN42741_c0_g1~~TRINITY_DN42741_c0_g1_i1.p1  ORF type:complete len:348 (-),score=33.77 TRINITY_DN42741_c0_g1_i1:56-1099(-)
MGAWRDERISVQLSWVAMMERPASMSLLPLPAVASRRRPRRAKQTWLVAACAVLAVLQLTRTKDSRANVRVVAGFTSAGTASFLGGNIEENITAAATQGAVAAVLAAFLSAFTEPVVNRLLVDRCSLEEALHAVKLRDCLKFFLTTFPTNLLRIPVFEVINAVVSNTSLTGSMRGVCSGALFCTLMLPVTNFRYRRSMNLPIEPAVLFQAYPPTLLRDIVYGWSRTVLGGKLQLALLPIFGNTPTAKCVIFGLTVLLACIVSSPMNELRGYWLQPPGRKMKFSNFFKPERYLRSTSVGAATMGISLGIGMWMSPPARYLFSLVSSSLVLSVSFAGLLILAIVRLSMA